MTLTASCKDLYRAPVQNPPTGYLVVEGFINVGGDSTKFTLSRTTGLDSPYIIPENGAIVSVQSANGSEYPMTEIGGGHYVLGSFPVDLNQRYRIYIKTLDGKQYQSDLADAKITPPIDSISWAPAGGGINLYVSTHDASNKSIYYQWDYVETWEYATPYISVVIYLGNYQFDRRPDSLQFHVCYMTDLSANILIGSTAKLSQDILYETPIAFIPYQGVNKLTRRYSVLVKQHVLTKDWYEWEQRVKKNTEQLGSIFDAQPSDISGNIHNTADAKETVIGYVGCSSETQQRRFIARSELPPVSVTTGYEDCMIDTVKNNHDAIAEHFDRGMLTPISPVYNMNAIVAYTASGPYCVDCRLYGGTTTKPDFW